MHKFKAAISVLLIIAICIVAAGAIGYGAYWWYKLPRAGWQKIQGCVNSTDIEAKYQFYGKSNWYLLTPDMGCGKTYPDAETWGIKDKTVNNETSDYSQITILLVNAKTNTSDENHFAYFGIPDQDGWYIELGRITADTGSEVIGITDKEWQYIKNSFRFR